MHKLLSKKYAKVWDLLKKTFYYVEKATGKASWVKPKGMGSEDIPVSARSRTGRYTVRAHRTPRVLRKI